MKKIFHSFLFLLIILSLFNCRKTPDYIGNPDPDPTPVAITPDPITAKLQGNIVDENGLPAEGVSITTGSQNAVTDARGYFKINNATLDKKNTLVLAQKSGYFKGIRHFAATSGTNYVFIKLIKKVQAGTIDASAGGSVTLVNGSIVALPANGIKVQSSGNDYTGQINVYAQYIDPSAADIAATIPGSLAAIDKNGANVILTSYGMMAVELESATGEKLQIKDGYVATLTSPIPAVAVSSAPSTISLWYVDEQNGLWIEDGTATKQGNNYVGDVKHFSFWNCDFSTGGVMLSMTLLNTDNSALVNTAVRLTRPATTWLNIITGYTDSLGQVSGMVPMNENLVMEVLDPCGTVLYSQNISPLTQDTNLGNITVTTTSTSIVTVNGRLLDCNNLPVSNGYAMITFDNNTRYASVDANGNYQTTFAMCPGSGSGASILAIDNGTGGAAQHSTSVIVNLTSPVSNLSDIVVCDATPFPYINYNIDGTDYYWTEQNSFQMFGHNFPGSVSFQADDQPGPRQFLLNIDGTAVGTYNATFTSTDAFTSGSVFYLPGFTGTITTYCTSWPDYFEGSFSGQYTNSATGSTIHTINGTFRIKHQF